MRVARLIVMLTLLGVVVTPAASATSAQLARATVGSPATSVPQPGPCAGNWDVPPAAATPATTFSAFVSCPLHVFAFTGQSATPLDLCSDAAQGTVTLVGTEAEDGGPAQNAVWTLRGGVGGAFLLTAADAPRWRGLLIPSDGCATATGQDGDVVLASASGRGPTPDVLACHASGTEGPNSATAGGPSFDGTTWTTTSGPVSGNGDCISERGRWRLTYTGTWAQQVQSTDTSCEPDMFTASVTVTNRLTGEVATETQTWEPTSADRRVATVTYGWLGAPIGVGALTESAAPCSAPVTMTTAFTWTFALAS